MKSFPWDKQKMPRSGFLMYFPGGLEARIHAKNLDWMGHPANPALPMESSQTLFAGKPGYFGILAMQHLPALWGIEMRLFLPIAVINRLT